MRKRLRSPLPLTLACVLTLCLTLAGGALVACGEDSPSTDGGGTHSSFAGLWEAIEASFDITWDDSSRSYSLSSGGSGGGLEVIEADAGLTVTLVGKSGVRSDALPATDGGETLSFAIPISEEMPTDATLTSTGDGTATLTLAGTDNTWDFQKTDEITLED